MKTNLNEMAYAMANFIQVSKECGYIIEAIEIKKMEEEKAETESEEPEFQAVVECTYGERESMEEVEKENIRRALLRNHNSIRETAKELCVSERTLIRKIKQYKLNK